jgi:hypothetical protein
LTLWQNGSFETIMTHTSNLGAGGVLIFIDRSFMIGAKVEVRIDFSTDQVFECNGMVLRCQHNREDFGEQKGIYSVAIAFEGLDEPKVVYLKELIEKLIEDEGQ